MYHLLVPGRGLQPVYTRDLGFTATYQRSVVVVDLLVTDTREGLQVGELLEEPGSIYVQLNTARMA